MGGRSTDLLQGTLDMLIMHTLLGGKRHGYAIMNSIQDISDDVLSIEEGSLYPALHRLEAKGWIKSDWGISENRRRARFYRITPTGRKQLTLERSLWEKLRMATDRVLEVRPSGSQG